MTETQATGARRSRRERRRARRPWGVWVIVGAVVLTAAGAGAFVGLRGLAARADALTKLQRGLELLREADPAVVRMDEVIGGDISSGTVAAAVEAEAGLASARRQLEEAARLLAAARGGVPAGDRELAEAARLAANARASLLKKGAPLLAVNTKAALALKPASESWQMMLDSQRLADGAVAQYNLHTEAGVRKSDTLAAQATEKLKAARALMSEAASAFPEAGLGVHLAYADSELAALAKAKAVNAAWLKGDKVKANELLREFNRLESKASGLGRKLEAPSAAISKAYDLLVIDLLPAYSEARTAATAADEALNSLGP